MKLLKLISNFFLGIKPSEVKNSMEKPKHLLIAEKELGVYEYVNGENPRILEYHSATHLKATADEISWCSSFVNWCLREAGELGSMQANARSFLDWGIFVKNPQVGDVVVFWRGSKKGWMGHVAFYISENSTHIKVLGGNQADKVCYAEYPKKQFLAYRRLQ